jgi:hypothetical protein
MRSLKDFRPYQHESKDFLHRVPRGYLAAKPGAGKTAITLAYLAERMFDYFDVQKALIVAPKRVVPQWGFEAGRWTFGEGMRFVMYAGAPQDRAEALKRVGGTDVAVVSFEFLGELLRAFPRKRDWPFQVVVFDEASRLRNGGRRGSQTWKAVNTIARKTDSRIHLLSGSPRPGSAHELYGPVSILDGGQRLGDTLAKFRAAYLEPDKIDRSSGQVYSWRTRYGMEPVLYRDIGDLYYAVSPDLGIQINEIDWRVPLPNNVEAMIGQLRAHNVLDIDDLHEVTAGQASTVVGKIHQIEQGCLYDDTGVAHEIHGEKLDHLEEILEEIDRPTLVCPWYQADMRRLMEIPGAVNLSTDKGLAAAKAGQVQLGVLHPGSAGHGIDGLQQHFSNIVFYTCPRSYELYDQTVRRIARSGQKETVTVYRMVAGEVDQRVVDELARKAAEQERFFDFLQGDPVA